LRFKVGGASPRTFDEEHLARLADRKAGAVTYPSPDQGRTLFD
jgi:hypothetical protein